MPQIKPTENLKFTIQLWLEASRCHEPQTALIAYCKRNIKSYEKLNSFQRTEFNDLLYDLWDVWKPQCINSNCGEVDNNTEVHWKLDYNHQTWSKLLKQMIASL